MESGRPSDAPPIGLYEPLLELGRGGMGVVLLARAVGAGRFERLVVLKRMHEWLLQNPDAIQRFLHEAHLASTIHHANVVAIHQVGKDDNGYFLVLDYIEGASLEELGDRCVLRNEHVPPPILLRIALDSLAGLSAAHEARDAFGRPLAILHRDVSLQNILVGRDGVARIADFGIAKSEIASVSTDRSYLVGKLLYVPPEHFRREPATPAFDIYSLGITLWMALTGDDPWGAGDEAQLVHRILQGRVPPVSSTGISIAPQLQELIDRATASDRAYRFSSAREMTDAIVELDRHTGWIASHTEVADWVARLMDVDLERRRAAVAELASAAPTRKGRADSLAHTPTVGGLASSSDELVGPVPVRRRRGAWAVPTVLGVVVALVAAAVTWSATKGSRTPGSAVMDISSAPTIPSASGSSAEGQPEGPPVAASVAPDSSGRASEPDTGTGSHRPPPRIPSQPSATGLPASGTSEAAPPTDDSDISKRNPYR